MIFKRPAKLNSSTCIDSDSSEVSTDSEVEETPKPTRNHRWAAFKADLAGSIRYFFFAFSDFNNKDLSVETSKFRKQNTIKNSLWNFIHHFFLFSIVTKVLMVRSLTKLIGQYRYFRLFRNDRWSTHRDSRREPDWLTVSFFFLYRLLHLSSVIIRCLKPDKSKTRKWQLYAGISRN